MKRKSRRGSARVCYVFMMSLAGACLAGCDSSTVPVTPTATEDTARTTLDKALNAWREGGSVSAMKEANPSIVVADPKWEKGQKLSKYEVLGAGEPSGAERVFQVTLWLVDDAGKESVENVAYRVGTQPILTVFRSMF